jgi:hypothetical protein
MRLPSIFNILTMPGAIIGGLVSSATALIGSRFMLGAATNAVTTVVANNGITAATVTGAANTAVTSAAQGITTVVATQGTAAAHAASSLVTSATAAAHAAVTTAHPIAAAATAHGATAAVAQSGVIKAAFLGAKIGMAHATVHTAAATGLMIGGMAITPFIGIVAAGVIAGALICGYIGKKRMEAEQHSDMDRDRSHNLALGQARSRAPVIEQEYNNPTPRIPFLQQMQQRAAQMGIGGSPSH